MSKRDYYDVLGVDKNASDADIKKAYRKQAMKFHPDRNPDDKGAEDKFKEANEAYEVLGDTEKKSRYDRFGHAGVDPNMGGGGFGGFGGGGGFEDIFGDIFEGFGFGGGGGRRRNGPRKGRDIRMNVVIEFTDAAFGVKRDIEILRTEECNTCEGSGAEPGNSMTQCPKCKGAGELRYAQRSLFGETIQVRECDQCKGKGEIPEKPCHTCKGHGIVRKRKHMDVKIPAGIEDGMVITLRGEGDLGSKGGPRGDIYLVVQVKPHEIFKREGNNIICEIPITFTQAALGDNITVPTLDGKVKYAIPEGTQTGTVFRLKGKGIQDINGYGRGDQFVKVTIETPKNLNKDQRKMLEDFSASLGESGHERQKGFFDKVKEAFA